ncbi:MAG: tetratricopeptide repeat protein [Candidatus Eisenbacteria sp.]|nr:tetratricopeptide repeat protein [Candidatus Eisenbacteria bacterium]
MMRFNSPLVWVSLLIAAAVAALSGCVGTMPEEEGQTLMTIRGSGETAPAVELSPAEKAAQNAAEFYRVREVGKAIENYEKAIALDPEFVDPYLGLGRIYLVETQEFEKTLEMYEAARDLAPDDPYTRTSLAYAHSVMGNYQESVNEYVAAVQMRPDDADIFLNLGYAYEKMTMDLAALNAYRRAFELSPTDPRAAQQLAHIYYRAGLFDQAIAAYEKVRGYGAASQYTLKTLGFLYMKVGKLDDAETLFLTVLQKDPADFGSRANLASVYRSTGEYTKALAQYEALVETQPSNPDFLGALADAYNDVRRSDSAIATAQRLLQVSQGNGSAYVSWAKALEHKADSRCEATDYDGGVALYGQAIKQLEQARMDPDWKSHANNEIVRQNKLIDIAQQAKLRGIWERG